jgi:hypothetical protein
MDYRAEARRIAQEIGIDPDLFVRMINRESSFDPTAVSPKGAIGLGQLMPGTASDLGVDPTDPIQNLTGAARYYKQQLEAFGNPMIALAAYNAGPGNVRKYGGIPPFDETQKYVQDIMKGYVGNNTMTPTSAPLTASMTPNAASATTTTQKPGKGMLRGLLDYASEKSPDTGLTRFQSFAAALDPLIMPEMRAGTAIRQAGQTQLDQGKVNKTVEWLKKNGYGDIAAIVEKNPEMAATVMGSIVQERIKKPGVKVIDDKLVDETGKVLYEGSDPEKLKQLDEKQVTVVRNLSNDLLKSYKIYNEVGNGYRLISNAIQNRTGVDDYVLSVAFAKILDPESVVRESEQAAVAKSGGAIDAFVKSVNNFIAGTGSLPEPVRQRIFSTAQTTAKYWYDEAQKEYNRAKRVASYAGIGEDIIADVLPQASPLPEIPPLSVPEGGDGNAEIGANGPVPEDLKDLYTQDEWNRLSADQVRQLLEASNNNGD